MRVATGTRIGQYEVLGLVGAGGMGEVYRGRDTRLQRTVAIKVITGDLVDDDIIERFESEALSASALNHPGILTVHEFGEHQGLHYLVTEFIEGETLRQHLKHGPMRVDEALDVAIQIASALDTAHAAGLIHRDVKPENVMLRPDGFVKLLDFGLAKVAIAPDAAASGDTRVARTQPGIMLGTIGYMAPEQVRCQAVDHRADIWSIGVVLHEMITGDSPFAARTGRRCHRLRTRAAATEAIRPGDTGARGARGGHQPRPGQGSQRQIPKREGSAARAAAHQTGRRA